MELRIRKQLQNDRDLELSKYTNVPVEIIRTYSLKTIENVQMGPENEDNMTIEEQLIELYRTYKYTSFDAHLRTMMFTSSRKRPDSLLKLARESNHILNFGSGCGTHTIYANEHGNHVTDLDVQGKMTEFAEWRLNLRGHNNYERVPHTFDLPSNKYDGVICVAVLEHLMNPLAAFKRILKSMKPNGKICLLVSKIIKPTAGHFSFSINQWMKEGIPYLNKTCKFLGDSLYIKR